MHATTPEERRRAHRHVGAGALAAVTVGLLLALVHHTAQAEPATPASASVTPAPAGWTPDDGSLRAGRAFSSRPAAPP